MISMRMYKGTRRDKTDSSKNEAVQVKLILN